MDEVENAVLNALRTLGQDRRGRRAWGNVVLSMKWEDGRIKLWAVTEETVVHPRDARAEKAKVP